MYQLRKEKESLQVQPALRHGGQQGARQLFSAACGKLLRHGGQWQPWLSSPTSSRPWAPCVDEDDESQNLESDLKGKSRNVPEGHPHRGCWMTPGGCYHPCQADQLGAALGPCPGPREDRVFRAALQSSPWNWAHLPDSTPAKWN